MADSSPDSLLPLPPATFHILMAVAHHDRLGDAIIQGSAAAPGTCASGARQRVRAPERVVKRYRALLFLYPKSFRADFGREMDAIYARRAKQVNGVSRAVLWVEAFA